MVTVNVKRLNADAVMPKYAHENDAGMDICSCEDYTLKPGERRTFSTGISTSFPAGYVALVWDRSGNAAKHGIKTMAGVVDAGYRGEYKIVLLNTSDSDFEVKKGDRIAQLLIQPVIHAEIEEVDDLEGSARGSGGFGSTGRR